MKTEEKKSEIPYWDELEKIVIAISKGQKSSRVEAIKEIFRAAVRLAQLSPGTLNLKITATVLKELRASFKIFSPDRTSPKITIFGSARVPPEDPTYKLAKQFADEAVKRSFMIITGGGPGVMAAGNEGARDHSFGLNIRLPMEQLPNVYIDPKKRLINYKYFFVRKLFLVKEACAVVLFPGGFGTLDEGFEILTLLQTGKSNIVPIIFLEPKGVGFWEGVHRCINEELLGKGFISETDKSLYCICHTAKEALDHIQHFYTRYHSMRFVKDKLVIRLKRALSEKELEKLRAAFGFLSMDGKIDSSGPLKEESNEEELKDLPRLVFPFERRDFGSLRRLIDFLNAV